MPQTVLLLFNVAKRQIATVGEKNIFDINFISSKKMINSARYFANTYNSAKYLAD